jgi:glycosyltransferase involved in cell wall biosynthesis
LNVELGGRGLARRSQESGREKIMGLSQYTKRTREEIAGEPIVTTVLPMPVDATFWTPKLESRMMGRVGFCGRLSDPRKNIDLLLAAVSRASVYMAEISALLIGGEVDSRIQARYLFVLPSHQEGLCIAALEAMACGDLYPVWWA